MIEFSLACSISLERFNYINSSVLNNIFISKFEVFGDFLTFSKEARLVKFIFVSKRVKNLKSYLFYLLNRLRIFSWFYSWLRSFSLLSRLIWLTWLCGLRSLSCCCGLNWFSWFIRLGWLGRLNWLRWFSLLRLHWLWLRLNRFFLGWIFRSIFRIDIVIDLWSFYLSITDYSNTCNWFRFFVFSWNYNRKLFLYITASIRAHFSRLWSFSCVSFHFCFWLNYIFCFACVNLLFFFCSWSSSSRCHTSTKKHIV